MFRWLIIGFMTIAISLLSCLELEEGTLDKVKREKGRSSSKGKQTKSDTTRTEKTDKDYKLLE